MGVKIPGTYLAFGQARLFCVTLTKVEILHSNGGKSLTQLKDKLPRFWSVQIKLMSVVK